MFATLVGLLQEGKLILRSLVKASIFFVSITVKLDGAGIELLLSGGNGAIELQEDPRPCPLSLPMAEMP